VTVELRRDRPGIGHFHLRIIRLIADGARHPTQIASRLHDFSGSENLRNVLRGLVVRGYLVQARGGVVSLTNKALEVLPTSVPQRWQTSNYVAMQAAPRRPGSDHSHLPSLAGGRKIYRGQAHA